MRILNVQFLFSKESRRRREDLTIFENLLRTKITVKSFHYLEGNWEIINGSFAKINASLKAFI